MGDGQNWQQGGYGNPPSGPPNYGPPQSPPQGPGPAAPWSGNPGGPPPPSPQQWQAPQPPSGRGKKLGLVLGFVVVLAVVAVGGVYLKNHMGDSGEKTEVTSYQLVLPVTTGDFRIAKPAEKVTEFDKDRLDKVGLSNPRASPPRTTRGSRPRRPPTWATSRSSATARSPRWVCSVRGARWPTLKRPWTG